MASTQLCSFKSALARSKFPVVVAGAGLSAASGIPTFRGKGGYWKTRDALSLATPEAFREDPSLVWQFYHMRRELCMKARPNAAHRTIARLMTDVQIQNQIFPSLEHMENFSLITQNVDGLSSRALEEVTSSDEYTSEKIWSNLLEMHGSLFKTVCTACRSTSLNFTSPICSALAGTEDQNKPYSSIPVEELPRCKEKGCDGLLRPGVASLSQTVKDNGGKVAVFNIEKSGELQDEADWFFEGKVEDTLSWVLGMDSGADVCVHATESEVRGPS